MNINRCYEILEISPNATYEEAKTAYRLMCQVWHPDKYSHSEQLQAKATSKIKEINEAWSQIEEHFKSGASREAEARETESRAREERERSKRAEQEGSQKEAAVEELRNQQRKQNQQTFQRSHSPSVNKTSISIPMIYLSIIAVMIITTIFLYWLDH
jgi:curved DNA-binding protein CbpA